MKFNGATQGCLARLVITLIYIFFIGKSLGTL
jgi:hypothetical protein